MFSSTFSNRYVRYSLIFLALGFFSFFSTTQAACGDGVLQTNQTCNDLDDANSSYVTLLEADGNSLCSISRDGTTQVLCDYTSAVVNALGSGETLGIFSTGGILYDIGHLDNYPFSEELDISGIDFNLIPANGTQVVIKEVRCHEQCDDGNTLGGDGCNSSCQREYCGDTDVASGSFSAFTYPTGAVNTGTQNLVSTHLDSTIGLNGGPDDLATATAYGAQVESIGDLNDDGYPDIAVAAPTDNDGGREYGAIYIHFMTGDKTSIGYQKISALTGGGQALGLGSTDRLGYGLAGLGDIDGDGVEDIAAGSYTDDDGGGNKGAIYILFMNTDGTVKSFQKISQTSGNGPTLYANDYYGRSVADIGDINNDGIEDIAVGAYTADDGGSNRGAVYIHTLTSAGTVGSTVKIAHGLGGFPTTYLGNSDSFGIAVDGLGDIDGDGTEDIVVGAYRDDDGGTNRGAVYILLLNNDGTVKSVQKISELSGGGPALGNSDHYGFSVAGLDDLDGDGTGDVLVGAYAGDDGAGSAGEAYVHFLNSNGTIKATQKISELSGGGPNLDGSDYYAYAATLIPDLDGDGIEDLAVGAYGDDDGGSNAGAFYVHSLTTSGTISSTQKITEGVGGGPAVLDSINYYGYALDLIGDLDDDGVEDIVVGAYGDDDGGPRRGAVYVQFMNTDGSVKSWQKISSTQGNGPTLDNADQYGKGVAEIGDLDGDGVEDIAVGAPLDDDGGTNRGAVYIHFMNTNGTVASTQKISETSGNGPVLGDSDYFGKAVSAIGDINGDGIEDLAVGAYGDDDAHGAAGAVYILFMNTSGTVASHQKISETIGGGPDLDYIDYYGWDVTGLGDLDNDGIEDIAVGAHYDDDGGTNRGAVYIHLMNSNGTVKSTQKLSDATIGGPSLDNADYFGVSIANGGDVDGDGVSDLLVGAYADDDGGSAVGAIYIVFLNTDGSMKSFEKISETSNGGPILAAANYLGYALAGGSDLNNDGSNDIIASAVGKDSQLNNIGNIFAVFMQPKLTYDLSEQCDDGNNISGDGCNAQCSCEIFYLDTDGDGWSDGTTVDGCTYTGSTIDYYTADRLKQTAQETTLQDDLVARYSFDAGDATDDSGNGNDGTETNTSYDASSVGGSKLVDGSIVIADHDDLDITDNITLSLWMYPTGTGTYYSQNPFKKQTNTTDSNFNLYYFGDNTDNVAAPHPYVGRIGFLATAGGTWKRLSPSGSPALLSIGNWSHVVLEYEKDTGGQLYIDGVPYGSRTGGGALATNAQDILINSVSSPDIDIDNISIYNRSLSASEITDLYNSAAGAYPGGDCNDTNSGIHPGASEIVADGIDGNCDGAELCYEDLDGDSYGTTTIISSTNLVCTDTGEANRDNDCDDTNAELTPLTLRYEDADGDGYGHSSVTIDFASGDISGDLGDGFATEMGDIDGDGDLDIYVTNYNGQQNKLRINDGLGNFVSQDISGDIGDGFATEMGDIDGDGDLDIYVTNYNSQQNKLRINDGLGNFVSQDISGDIGDGFATEMGDIDGDGDLDIYVTNYNGQQNKLRINDGFGNFVSQDISGDLGHSYGVDIGDIDGDGDLDIYVTNYNGQQNKLRINDGLGNFVSQDISGDIGDGFATEMGDIDGDGDLDIYVTNYNSQQNKLRINDGLGNFVSQDISGDIGDGFATEMGDIDGDGDLDIYVTNYNSQQNKLRINDGLGNFVSQDISGDLGHSYGVDIGDIDGDGDLDIYVTNFSSQNKLRINNTIVEGREMQCASPGTGWALSGSLTDISGDCNDIDSTLNPETYWYEDVDGDGYTSSTEIVQCTMPADHYTFDQITTEMILSASGTNTCTVNYQGFGYSRCDYDANIVNDIVSGDKIYVFDSMTDEFLSLATVDRIDSGLSLFFVMPEGDAYNYLHSPGDRTIYIKIIPNDCNDTNSGIHPGAEEVCDNLDNNCNGNIDEGGRGLYYKDTDGDGWSDGTSLEACIDFNAGLVAYYTFDNDDANDDSGNGNNGTENGGVSYVDGKIDRATVFDGVDDIVEIADNAALDITDAITVSMWINPDTFDNTAANNYPTLISKGSQNYRWYFNPSGALVARYNIGGAQRSMTTNSGIATGSWTHATMTYDGTTWIWYINGQENTATTAFSGVITDNNATMALGNWSSASVTRMYDGSMDDVRIYNRAMGSGEISALYDVTNGYYLAEELKQTAQETTLDEGLVARYSFDAGDATDDSGNGNNGTLIGDTVSSVGKISSGMNFDGNGDYIDSGITGIDLQQDNITFSQRIYPTSAHDGIIIGKCGINGCEETDGSFMVRFTDEGSIELRVEDKGNIESFGSVAINTWTHVSVTYNVSTDIGRIYINGVETVSGTIYPDGIGHVESLFYGGTNVLDGFFGDEHFDGQLDEVRIYDRALTSDEITDLYTSAVGDYPAIDCNDTNPSIHPGAEEICNEIDENCNILIDESTMIPVSECNALINFYKSTNGSGWTDDSGWFTEYNINNWNGINASDAHVREIDLPANNLSGAILAEIEYLTELETLELKTNAITGPLPDEIWELSNLVVMDMSNNMITSLGDGVENATSLEELYLESNQISGTIPPALGLTNLQLLNLGDNNITGEIPSELGNITTLYELSLNDNLLTGTIPSELGLLTNIDVLYISNNSLIGPVPDSFANMTVMSEFSAEQNNLDRDPLHCTIIPPSLAGVAGAFLDYCSQGDITPPVLTIGSNDIFTTDGTIDVTFDIDENSYAIAGDLSTYALNGEGMRVEVDGHPAQNCDRRQAEDVMVNSGTVTLTLTNTTDLSVNSFGECRLRVEDHASNFSNYIYLNDFVNGTTLTDFCVHPQIEIPNTECEALADLYTDTNGSTWANDTNWFATTDVNDRYGLTTTGSLTGFYSRGSFIATSYAHVTDVDLERNLLQAGLPSNISDLTELVTLNLYGNNILDIGPGVTSLAKLESLNLGRNALTTLPGDWSGLAALEDLNISENQLTSLPASMAQMSQLVTLDAEENNLSSFLPASVGTSPLPNLAILNLGDNAFVGVGPEEIAELSALTVLYMDYNLGLTALPDDIGDLSNLQTLKVNNAALTGFPDSIENLDALATIYAQYNNITGLPTTIGGMDSLQRLYIHHNQLAGLPAGFDGLTSLHTLHISDNALTTFDSQLTNMTNLTHIYAQHNQMGGLLDDSLTNLTNLLAFYIHHNNFARMVDPTHEAVLSPILETRRVQREAASTINNNIFQLGLQDDIVGPVVAGTGVIPDPLILFFEYDLAWNEESYAENALGEGMDWIFSGAANCTNLEITPKSANTQLGSGTFKISSLDSDDYNGCSLVLQDHGANFSNEILLPDFYYSNDVSGFCGHPDFDGADPQKIPRSECETLVALYTGTNGLNYIDAPTWTKSTGWFTTTDVDDWRGVRTDMYAGQRHVDGLYFNSTFSDTNHDLFAQYLNGNGMLGELPNNIGNLIYLKDLNLSRNDISGTLPPSFSLLTNLEKRYSLDTNLMGSLPSNITDFDALEVLQLRNNNFTGLLPVGMNVLNVLDLTNNAFAGDIPTGLATMTTLEKLLIGGNNLSGWLPAGLGNLTALTNLGVENNVLIGTLPTTLSNLSALTIFSLEENNLDRLAQNHNAVIPSALQTWFFAPGLATTRQNQGDITAPVIAGTGSIPRQASGTLLYDIDVTENSYPVTTLGASMLITVSGDGGCSSLLASGATWNQGTQTVGLLPSAPGGYIDCELVLTDHGGNQSNSIILPSFIYALGNYTVCYDPALTIPTSECLALVDLYEDTDGINWHTESDANSVNDRLDTPDVDNWFGVTVVGGHVIRLEMGGANANNLSGTLNESIQDLTLLETLDLHGNSLSGALPVGIGTLINLEQLYLHDNNLAGPLPDWRNLSALTNINLSNNPLGGEIPTWIADWSSLEELRLSNTALIGGIPEELYTMSGLEELYLDDNKLSGTLPSVINSLNQLREFHVGNNLLEGEIPEELGQLSLLQILNLGSNQFIGVLPPEFTGMTAVTYVNVEANNLDRDIDPTHKTYIQPFSTLDVWAGGRTVILNNQGDITAPRMTAVTNNANIPHELGQGFDYIIHVVENSYPVTSAGFGMLVTVEGGGNCADLVISNSTRYVETNNGQHSLYITPSEEKVYNGCFLRITDHGGNTDDLILPTFSANLHCGNNIVEDGTNGTPDYDENCDEGRKCENGDSCTTSCSDGSACIPRMSNNCNPSCKASRCGDGYIDVDGVNVGETYDDETCDQGSYCTNDPTIDCTYDRGACSSNLLTSYRYCEARRSNGCIACKSQGCGDGFVDVAAGEECEDPAGDINKVDDGDGCDSSCQLEFCGDGVWDQYGPDNIAGTADDEECDEGGNNGVAGGICDSNCQALNDTCSFCYENCDGGTGSHSVYLLMDVSGSMDTITTNGQTRMENAKQGATNFVQIVKDRSLSNAGFDTKIGVMTFSSDETVIRAPTTNYDQLLTDITGINNPSGGTNFGDPIQAARNYFQANDRNYEQHVILLSDGEPSVGGPNPYQDPGIWALYQAAEARTDQNSNGNYLHLYTIAVDQTDEGLTYMSHLSSSTKLNYAWQGPTTATNTSQSSTYGSYTADLAVNAFTDGTEYALTDNAANHRWEIDLENNLNVEELNIWNRIPAADETANVTVKTLDANRNIIDSYIIAGQVGRPSTQELVSPNVRYVRVEMTGATGGIATIDPATLNPKIRLDAKDIDGDGIFADAETESCGVSYPSNILFDEDFESIGNGTLGSNGTIHSEPGYSLTYSQNGSRGRVRYGTRRQQDNGGGGAATLDVDSNGNRATNYLTFQIDLSSITSTNDLELAFDWSDHGDEDHAEDRVDIRGSSSDAWITVYDWKANDVGNGQYQTVSDIDIDAFLSSNGQSPTNSFQLRFGQRDNYRAQNTTSNDGLSIDNVRIIGSVGGTGTPIDCLDGSEVITWIDKSGNGNNPTLQDVVYKTSGSLDGVYVESSGNHGIKFDNSDITNGSIIIVGKKEGNDTDGTLLSAEQRYYFIGGWNNRGRVLYIDGTPGHYQGTPATSSENTTPHIYGYHKDGNTYEFRDMGEAISQGTTNNINGVTWTVNDYGYYNYHADIIISEFLVFDTVLTQEQIQGVEGYLAQKRGFTPLLPGSHPYGGSNGLGITEVEVLACPAVLPSWATECTDIYHYADFGGEIIETLYGHVFGNIHCGCEPTLEGCKTCGNGTIEADGSPNDEQCDEGLYCDDWRVISGTGTVNEVWTGTTCSSTTGCSTLGLGICETRYGNGCTEYCSFYECLDGVHQPWLGEQCDDGNQGAGANNDGCTINCKLEYCGDGVTQTSITANEYCDDGGVCSNNEGIACNYYDNTPCASANDACIDGVCEDGAINCIFVDTSGCGAGANCVPQSNDGCSDTCAFEITDRCGDGLIQAPNIDGIDELCDSGSYCDDWRVISGTGTVNEVWTGTYCSDNIEICGDGSCKPRFNPAKNCTATCDYGFCGDGFVQTGTFTGISGNDLLKSSLALPNVHPASSSSIEQENTEHFGQSVTIIGDIDGNNVDDFAIGDPYDDAGGIDRGAVWIMLMNSDGTVLSQQKITVDHMGINPSDYDRSYFGTSIAALGDTDGDTKLELAVGAPYDRSSDPFNGNEGDNAYGVVYLLELHTDGSLAGVNRVYGQEDELLFGSAITSLGVMNIDNDGNNGNIALAVSMQIKPSSPTSGFMPGVSIIELESVDVTTNPTTRITEGSAGYGGTIPVGEWFGKSLAHLGDIDANGTQDIAIGAPSYPYYGYYKGTAYNGNNTLTSSRIILATLDTDGTILTSTSITHADVSATPLDRFGTSVTSLGDLDADGVDDIVVGAAGDDDGGEHNGALYVLLMNADKTVRSVSKISDTVSNFSGTLTSHGRTNLGVSLAGIGDRDGDAYKDIIVGASRGISNGAAYIMQLQTDTIIRQEECDPRSRCEFGPAYANECTSDADCYFEDPQGGIVDLGACIVKSNGNCTDQCIFNVCGDTIVSPGNDNDPLTTDIDGSQEERCDPGQYDTDVCYGAQTTVGAACEFTICGDGVHQSLNGMNQIEECDDGLAGSADCRSDCTLIDDTATRCGDGITQNDTTTGGPNSDGIQEYCDSGPGNTSTCQNCQRVGQYCGDTIVQGEIAGNDDGLVEECEYDFQCQGGGNTDLRCSGCLCVTATCGDGIREPGTEECDDGNLNDNDGCTSICELENPLIPYGTLLGSCVDNRLPAINDNEILPYRRQLEPVSSIDESAISCADIANDKHIPAGNMMCDFGVWKFGTGGEEKVYTVDNVSCFSAPSALHTSIINGPYPADVASYPLLGTQFISSSDINSFVAGQAGQYQMKLEKIDYDFCVRNASGAIVDTIDATYEETICAMPFSVTQGYLSQKGSVVNAVANTELNDVVNIEGDIILTEGTASDPDSVLNTVSTYSAEDITYLASGFADTYEDRAVIEVNGGGLPDDTIYKVPNERIYFYKAINTSFTLDDIILKAMVGADLSVPFTFATTENVDINVEPMNDNVNGLFIVDGDIIFDAGTSCNDTDIYRGIFITTKDFDTTVTRNDDISATSWCVGGNMIIEGGLIGANIDETLFNARRSTTDYWEGDTVDIVFGGETNYVAQARKLFTMCYLPAILRGETTPYCDSNASLTRQDQFTSAEALSQKFKDIALTKNWTTETAMCPLPASGGMIVEEDSLCSWNTNAVPSSCSTNPSNCPIQLTCVNPTDGTAHGYYDASVLDINDPNSPVQILGDVQGHPMQSQAGFTCAPTSAGSYAGTPPGRTYGFAQRCSWETAAPPTSTICPAPNTYWWNRALDDVLVNGYNAGTPLAPLKDAFMGLDHVISRASLPSYIRPFDVIYKNLRDTDVDGLWMSTKRSYVIDQVGERQELIHDDASVKIELTPAIWEDLPPGSAELLEDLVVGKQ